MLHVPACVQRVDQDSVLLRDEAPPHLARPGELLVVGIELLVQNEKAPNLRFGERAFRRELGIRLLDAFADERVHLGLRCQIGVA